MIFLRKEPTTDGATLHNFKSDLTRAPYLDVQAYSDMACTQKVGRWPWYYSNKPTRRNKRVMLNCFQHEITWLPDLQKENTNGQKPSN